jgi:RNA polymerase sigma-70 factor (ECF subfamily)
MPRSASAERRPGSYFPEQAPPDDGHLGDVDRVLRIVPWPQGDPGRPADDERLVSGLKAGERWATTALVDRYGAHIRRVLLRVLGGEDSEHGDLLQEVLTRAWEAIDQLADPHALKGWLTGIAVFTARGAIRRRRRRRWLAFFGEVPDLEATWAGPDVQEAARCVYRIFERMPDDERIPFALRMLDGMDLEETAVACGMSLSTVRRRLTRAERRFFKLAREYEALAPWVEAR